MSDPHVDDFDPRVEIGCCGAYCKTCRALAEGACRGCKLGYADGERDITKSKCKMKLCCFMERKLMTCADCHDFASCPTIHGLYSKNGYKYKKYEQSIEFIRKNGYDRFIAQAAGWKGAYGKLDNIKRS